MPRPSSSAHAGSAGSRARCWGASRPGVLGHAHLPVLIVPPLEDGPAPGPVVIGYDGSEHADAAVEAAGRLLKVRETVLQTAWNSYRAVAPAGAGGRSGGRGHARRPRRSTARARERRQHTAEQGARLAAAQGLEVQAEAVEADGSAWHALLDAAYDHRAAAVVVGSRGNSAFESALIGSVSRALVHHAPAPVLVVRPPG